MEEKKEVPEEKKPLDLTDILVEILKTKKQKEKPKLIEAME
jgi:hypothetical protein